MVCSPLALGLGKYGEKGALARQIKFVDAVEKECSCRMRPGICGRAILDLLQHMDRIENRTVQSFKWRFTMAGKAVQNLRIDLFSGPTFPENQYRDIRRRDVEDGRVQRFHGFPVSNHKVGVGQKFGGARRFVHSFGPTAPGAELDWTPSRAQNSTASS